MDWMKLINIASFYNYGKSSNQESLMKILFYVCLCKDLNDHKVYKHKQFKFGLF
jgi:hypothetical protein